VAAGFAAASVGAAIIEGVGGLLTPIAESFTVCDYAVALGLPVLVAARPGLGTINHTLLTLGAARAAGLDVRAVVLTPWLLRPSRLERSNRATIARMGQVEVGVLPRVHRPHPGALAQAGAGLPWRRWLLRPPVDEPGEDQAIPARAASTTAAVTVSRSCSPIT